MSPRPDGRLGMPPACVPEDDATCSICGDEGLVGEVIEAPARAGSGRVALEGPEGEIQERRVAFDLLPEVAAGDRVVIHMGFAIARLRDEGEGGPAAREG